MIRKSKVNRYFNLIKNIKNWDKYLINKLINKDRLTYTTRKRKLQFEVPVNLGGVFKEIFFDEFYDLHRFNKKINSSSVVFDIGTNAGYFTIFVTEKLAPKEIHCFEPFPNNFELLSRNLKSIHSFPEIFLNNAAVVGSEAESIDLYFNENNSFSPTASTLQGIDTVNKAIKVKAVNLKNYFAEKNIEKIDLLKMDCEGAEYDIFYHLPESWFSKISSIYMETHDLNTVDNNTNSLVTFFNKKGYKTEVMPIDDHTAMVWAER